MPHFAKQMQFPVSPLSKTSGRGLDNAAGKKCSKSADVMEDKSQQHFPSEQEETMYLYQQPCTQANVQGLHPLFFQGQQALPGSIIFQQPAPSQRMYLQEVLGPNGKVMYTLVPEDTFATNFPQHPPSYMLPNPTFNQAMDPGLYASHPEFTYSPGLFPEMNYPDPRMTGPASHFDPRNFIYQHDPRVMLHREVPSNARHADGPSMGYQPSPPAFPPGYFPELYMGDKMVRHKQPLSNMHSGYLPMEMHRSEKCIPMSVLPVNPPVPPPMPEWERKQFLAPPLPYERGGFCVRPPPSSMPLVGNVLDELRISLGKGIRWESSHLRQQVVTFCRDQHGSRFIQQQFEIVNKHEKQIIFDEILPHAFSLMTDVFGNYVIQKVFDHGTADQREELAALIPGHAVELALQMYGCRVVQKALEFVSVPNLLSIIEEFKGHVLHCIQDQNGNHVIQKVIEVASKAAHQEGILPNGDTIHSRIQFIIDIFHGQTERLAMHSYGCRVIQRILEHCDNEQKLPVLEEIKANFSRLLLDQYGNYVIQHILKHGRPSDRLMLIQSVKGNLMSYSQHKFASNVVEKCLQFGSYEERAQIISCLFHQVDGRGSLLQQMVCDPYANYVVQKIIDVADDHQRIQIVNELRSHASQLKRYTFGKHIVARLEKCQARK